MLHFGYLSDLKLCPILRSTETTYPSNQQWISLHAQETWAKEEQLYPMEATDILYDLVLFLVCLFVCFNPGFMLFCVCMFVCFNPGFTTERPTDLELFYLVCLFVCFNPGFTPEYLLDLKFCQFYPQQSTVNFFTCNVSQEEAIAVNGSNKHTWLCDEKTLRVCLATLLVYRLKEMNQLKQQTAATSRVKKLDWDHCSLLSLSRS